MITYPLYLESGPKRRKTMVHVLDLLGCIARGATTEVALETTPAAIRRYLAFLSQIGEAVDPLAQFDMVIAEHVMQGDRLGEGNPTPGFKPDFLPLEAHDLVLYLRRLDGLLRELLALTGPLSDEQMLASPPVGNRTLYDILVHVAEAHCAYLRYTVGKVEGLNQALKPVYNGLTASLARQALAQVWQISQARLRVMSALERTQQIAHGQEIWTALRGLRRMLEHAWEHRLEIEKMIELGAG